MLISIIYNIIVAKLVFFIVCAYSAQADKERKVHTPFFDLLFGSDLGQIGVNVPKPGTILKSYKQRVIGSSPITPTRQKHGESRAFSFITKRNFVCVLCWRVLLKNPLYCHKPNLMKKTTYELCCSFFCR